MKQCKHCKQHFEATHYCTGVGREIDHEDDDNFLSTAIAVAVATEILSDSGGDCGGSSDTGSCDTSSSDASSSDFGGDGGDFGGGGSSSDF